MFKKLALAGVLAASLIGLGGAGGGCSFVEKVTANDRGVLDGQVADEKAVIVAEAAMRTGDYAAQAALDAGVLVPGSPLALRIDDGLNKAHQALVAARSFQRAGDADGFSARVRAAQTALADVLVLIPKPATAPTPAQ